MAGLETLYPSLWILTIEELLSSTNASPKGVSNPSWILHFEVDWVYTCLVLVTHCFLNQGIF